MATLPFRRERCITEIHLRKGAILEAIELALMGIYNKSARRSKETQCHSSHFIISSTRRAQQQEQQERRWRRP